MYKIQAVLLLQVIVAVGYIANPSVNNTVAIFDPLKTRFTDLQVLFQQ